MRYRSRTFYLGLNLLAPGVGQIALKWYFRGILELLIFIVAIAWGFMELLLPVINFLTNENAPLHFNYPPLIIAISAGLLVWLWSLVEIILFYTPSRPDKDQNCPDCKDEA